MKIVTLIAAFVSLSVPALAAAWNEPGSMRVSGYVESVEVEEDGSVLVALDEPHTNPQGCENDKTVVIRKSHKAKTEILAIILTAHATGKKAGFRMDGCYDQLGPSYAEAITATVIAE